ncbi:ABC transporter substrate-binding protein [Labrenzia sp. PHM005]|uniref:substrate-binding periplasmic protein n=1 Tax=Labrenzia sp. PHM005 TaxID=2590016 RepID=UPI001AD8EB10|nr:transporter substrate-binding domain-containing protein [Labrenzia sp. PHM005]
MARTGKLLALLIAGILGSLTLAAQAQDCPRGGTLIAGAGDYRPYNIVEGDTVTGMDFEVIETILNKMDCELTKIPLPWTRHLNAMRNGTVDIATPVTITPDREEFAHFSSPYIQANEILFVRTKDQSAYKDLADFFKKGKRLGVIRDYAYGGAFPELAKTYADQIETTDSQELNLKQLDLGRVDAILGETYVVSSVVQRLGLSRKVIPSNVIVASESNYIMFSKISVSEDFVAAFSRELQTMQENGEFDQITARYRNSQDVVN